MDPMQWVRKALYKGGDRPHMAEVFRCGHWAAATDGHRVHAVKLTDQQYTGMGDSARPMLSRAIASAEQDFHIVDFGSLQKYVRDYLRAQEPEARQLIKVRTEILAEKRHEGTPRARKYAVEQAQRMLTAGKTQLHRVELGSLVGVAGPYYVDARYVLAAVPARTLEFRLSLPTRPLGGPIVFYRKDVTVTTIALVMGMVS